MLLALNDVSVSRGGITVLEAVSFRIEPGQALVLRGSNGIGKTTLLRAITGLQPVLSGTIEAPEDSIAYAAHADGIKQVLTVRENLNFWASVFGTSSISSALQAFELESLKDRPAGTLSAGQKRRLGLARMVLSMRPIWVLDEPTVSLDQAAVELFANAVQTHLKNDGIALIATHIDLGLQANVLDLAPFKARVPMLDDAYEGFL